MRFTSTLPPSTKIGTLKSTFSMRDSVIVVVPHSMSASPFAIVKSRVAASTGFQSILSEGRPSDFWMLATTSMHNSTE